MAALAHSKKGKVDGLNESELILLGYYIKFGPRISRVTRISRNERLRHGEQVNRNFGIKLFLSQNWGRVFAPKFERKNAGTRSFQDYANQGVDCVKIDICRFGCDTGIGSL